MTETPASIPDSHLDLVTGTACATFVTLLPDGQPHATVVWVLYEDDAIWISTKKGAQKQINIERHPKVTLTVIDPQNPYRYIEIRGTTIVSDADVVETRRKLGVKYQRDQFNPAADADDREILKVTPTYVRTLGRG